jgi:hypothetical protein
LNEIIERLDDCKSGGTLARAVTSGSRLDDIRKELYKANKKLDELKKSDDKSLLGWESESNSKPKQAANGAQLKRGADQEDVLLTMRMLDDWIHN